MREPMTARDALAALAGAYEGSDAGDHGSEPVIGAVGQDVPIELIEAVGARPLRLRGNPSWELDRAEFYLGRGLDPAVTALLSGILDHRFGELAGLAVSSDCDASQRLFYVLRELRRVEPAVPLPPVHLVDVLHLPRESTHRYNLVRLGEFLRELKGWTSTSPGQEELGAAIVAENRVRAAQRRLLALRHADPSRLSGSDALRALGARTRLDREHYLNLLDAVVQGGAELPVCSGTRVFLTGSSHDSVDVYQKLESAGCVVVGDDHDWGELPSERDVDGSDLASLARRYRDNGPTPQRGTVPERARHTAHAVHASAAEVVLAYTRAKDEAPLWDIPLQRAALGVPLVTALRQRYGRLDRDALAGLAVVGAEAVTAPSERSQAHE